MGGKVGASAPLNLPGLQCLERALYAGSTRPGVSFSITCPRCNVSSDVAEVELRLSPDDRDPEARLGVAPASGAVALRGMKLRREPLSGFGRRLAGIRDRGFCWENADG